MDTGKIEIGLPCLIQPASTWITPRLQQQDPANWSLMRIHVAPGRSQQGSSSYLCPVSLCTGLSLRGWQALQQMAQTARWCNVCPFVVDGLQLNKVSMQ